MNTKQENIYRVIKAIFSVDSIENFHRNGEIRYGILNYIAKYSLARDRYFMTKTSSAFLNNNKFINEKGLRRGLKSVRNGFTYEHPIPSNVVADILFEHRKDPKKMRQILSCSDVVTILTREENKLLAKTFNSKMPEGWCIFKDSPFQRYFSAGIARTELEDTIRVYGAITR